MNSSNVQRLRQIRTFQDLVEYLRDGLEWPIDSDNFEDLTFDYEPEELGIETSTAVKIHEIKQLRPLTSNQPWGIFFIDFEPKRLPIVVLRRILRSLVVKKRSSANKAHQAAWQLHDLMFISSFGENDHREITFAHFSEPPDRLYGDLPTLRVLGWDENDTKLKLDHIVQTLSEKLRWPEDEANIETWREKWTEAFVLKHREVINTSKDLAVRLAALAKSIRQRASLVLSVESEHGQLRKLHQAFKTALIHDLDENDFADMYAQTIAYGLLAARVSRPAGIIADNIKDMVPVTNPFLSEMLGTFLTVGGRKGKIDFDELGIQDVVDLLNSPDTHLEDVLRDFGNRTMQEDPVIHFYELFLKEYDKKRKVQRGVFYTPQPVVSYIVRSVHELLKTQFGLEDGLASTVKWGEMAKLHKDLKIPNGVAPEHPFVQILDPATGTATFLVYVIETIHKTMMEKWKNQGRNPSEIASLWNKYVPRHLLPRMYGYELMMAPYAIAHMKIGLKLAETGYNFGSQERVRVYLTNALEPAAEVDRQFNLLEELAPALAHEALDVNKIKGHQPFTVVIGNPPYSTSISEPEWLMRLMQDWKLGLNETKSDLNREEWKFLRFGQYLCQTTKLGILGFVINRDFLDGITKRRMREYLGETFPLRIAVDLNGDVKGNISDENVFDIEQGVAIAILCTKSHKPRLRFVSAVGTRNKKYSDLLAKAQIDSAQIDLIAVSPYFRWLPLTGNNEPNAAAEYEKWLPIQDVFSLKSSGIQTKNDPICIGYDASELFEGVQQLLDLTPTKARQELGIGCGGAWTVENAQDDLRTFGVSREHVRRILYRPFDWRFIYYTHKSNGFLGRPRFEVMQHMLNGCNLGLIFNRQIVGDSVSHFGVCRDLTCHGTFYLGNKGQDYLAPLYLERVGLLASHIDGGNSNFRASFSATLRHRWGTKATDLSPEEILHFIYAVFHSPTYRTRYKECIKIDFPRLPLPTGLDLFQTLASLGGELVALHLVESPKLNDFITSYTGPKDPEIKKVGWCYETVWLDAAATKKGQSARPGTTGFRGVPADVWNFHIGGYQVCLKWLKDRKGRTLSEDDINHYQKIVVALKETIRIMGEIDEVIEQHGGWPGAFVGKD